MRRNVWSAEEIETLKNLYAISPRAEILAALPRWTWRAIYFKAHCIGIPRRGIAADSRRKLKIDRDGLVELYWNQNLSQDEIARRFSCNQRAVYQLMRRLEIPVRDSTGGDKRDLVWTEEENELIRRSYASAPQEQLLALMPKRSWQAVKVQASKLGIARDMPDFDPHNNRITELYYNERLSQTEVAKRLGVTRSAIEGRMGRARLNCRSREESSRISYYKNNQRYKLVAGLRNCSPTKPGKIVINVVRDHSLPFEYVGNRKVCVNGLYPDFVSTNGDRVIIEVFGRFFHDPQCSVYQLRPQSTEKVRRAIYGKAGYKMLVLWDDDLATMSGEEVKGRICSFIGK